MGSGLNAERFPGLRGGWARLDGPAGTQMVEDAIEAMAAFMRSGDNANHGGLFAAARATDATVAEARHEVGALLGADPEGVAFGPSATAMTMRFAAAAGRALSPGDEVVVTRLDHDANVRPWVIAAERAGATVRYAEPGARAARAAGERGRGRCWASAPRWVAVTAASNACGSVPELPGIVAAAHEAGARVYVDAVHAAPHRPIDLAALGADALVCSAYKWFGPHVGDPRGATRAARGAAARQALPSPDEAPDRWELGTLPFESLAGRDARRRDYVRETGFDRVRAHEDALLARALDGLRAIDGVTLHGDARDRTPTLMFTVAGMTSRAGRGRAGRARDRGLARQLLRVGARALPGPRPRRRGPRGLRALQRARGRRPACDGGHGTRGLIGRFSASSVAVDPIARPRGGGHPAYSPSTPQLRGPNDPRTPRSTRPHESRDPGGGAHRARRSRDRPHPLDRGLGRLMVTKEMIIKARPQVTGAVKPPRYRPRAAAADPAAAPQPAGSSTADRSPARSSRPGSVPRGRWHRRSGRFRDRSASLWRR